MRLAKDNICLSAVAQNENGQVESAARETLSEREGERGEEAITNENEIRRQKLCKAAVNRNAAKSKKKVQENKKK